MKFNFSEAFKNYSNTDLLKIVSRPEDYEQEAIDAATQILSERQVSEDETFAAKKYYEEINAKQVSRNKNILAVKKRIFEVVKTLAAPKAAIMPARWVDVFLTLMALQYLWILYKTIRLFISFARCNYCLWDVSYFIQLAALIYMPILFYLILKKKKWGWIIFFADNLITSISIVGWLYLFFRYKAFYFGDILTLLIIWIIRVALLYFLWKNEIASYFNISPNLKKRTLIFTIILILIFIIVLMILNLLMM